MVKMEISITILLSICTIHVLKQPPRSKSRFGVTCSSSYLPRLSGQPSVLLASRGCRADLEQTAVCVNYFWTNWRPQVYLKQ